MKMKKKNLWIGVDKQCRPRICIQYFLQRRLVYGEPSIGTLMLAVYNLHPRVYPSAGYRRLQHGLQRRDAKNHQVFAFARSFRKASDVLFFAG